MVLSKEQKTVLAGVLTNVLFRLRKQFFAEHPNEGIKFRDQLLTRLRMSARSSGSLGEWGTKLARGMRLSAPSNFLSSNLLGLETTLAEMGAGAEDAFLRWVDSEHTLHMARLQAAVDADREERDLQAMGKPSLREEMGKSVG